MSQFTGLFACLVMLLSLGREIAVCQGRTAGDRKQAQQRREKLPPEIDMIVQIARSATPELASDALIRVATSRKVVDRQTRIELLVDAFVVARSARKPVRRVYTGKPRPFTQDLVKSLAFDLKLDQLSLRRRAIEGMLHLDPERARRLFSDLGPLRLERAGCAEWLVDDVSDYYDLAAAVTGRGFSIEEKRREDHIFFAEQVLRGITSPAELGAAARMVVEISPTGTQLERLIVAYAGAIDRVAGDDRTSSWWLGRLDAALRGRLIPLMTQKEVPVAPLLAAYRRYFVRHLTGLRCAENVVPDSAQASLEARISAFFSKQELPLSENERKPEKIQDVRTPESFFGDEEELIGKARDLVFAGKKKLSEDEKNTTAWWGRLDDFLGYVEKRMAGQGRSDADIFQQKCSLLSEVAAVVPPGRDRDRILAFYMSVLSSSPVHDQSWGDWFVSVVGLMEMTKTLYPDELDKVFAALEGSRYSDLRLYSLLERHLPPNDPGPSSKSAK